MGELRLNLKTVIFMIVIIIIAFVGVLSGSWFINWKNSNVEADNLYNDIPVIKTLFNKNDPFPTLDLIDINGKQIESNNIFQTSHTIVLFLAPGCEPCCDAISYWKIFYNKLPEGFQLIGLCQSELESGQSYILESGFPFPVYFDTSYTLSINFEVNQFPNVMGVFNSGKIAFLNRGLYGDFSPLDACNLIKEEL